MKCRARYFFNRYYKQLHFFQSIGTVIHCSTLKLTVCIKKMDDPAAGKKDNIHIEAETSTESALSTNNETDKKASSTRPDTTGIESDTGNAAFAMKADHDEATPTNANEKKEYEGIVHGKPEGRNSERTRDDAKVYIDNVSMPRDEKDPESPILEGDQMKDILYSIHDTPPWYLCILLGFQHYLTAVGAIIAVPLLLSEFFCLDRDTVGISELIGTIFFVSGIATLLQTTFGVRLPIVQGGQLSFAVPTIAIMTQEQWQCEYTQARETHSGPLNLTELGLPEIGSPEHREMWQMRIREIQGAIMVAAVFQVVIGFSGIMGLILRFIGPLSITPTVCLVGLALFKYGSDMASKHWWITVVTMLLVTIFSQYLRHVTIPIPFLKIPARNDGNRKGLPIFSLFPVLLAIVVVWGICAILTATDVLSPEEGAWGYEARTDVKLDVLQKAQWFRFPYPGQWGMPTVRLSSVLGMLSAVLANMVESVGDYYACARLAGAPPPPTHAVNRGIGMEGIGCIVTGAWGSGNATTSYSENIGVIGITKVGSVRVVQVGGIMMLLLGCLGKFGALFATIPAPVVGGMFMITFGMVTAVGLSNLQYVDLNSSRNIFILGVSLFAGLSIPTWFAEHKGVINTGNQTADEILSVLLSTSMFVGGTLGFVLDNTIPGTPEERGILAWRKVSAGSSSYEDDPRSSVYDIPLIQNCLNKVRLFRYIPCCPSFLSSRSEKRKVT